VFMAEYHLRTPLSEEDVRRLRVGDIVYLSGIIVTAQDSAHRRLLKYYREGREIPVDLRGGVIYHCGPVVKRTDRGWEVIAVGPTTSARMETYEAEIIEKLGVRMIIGKGGMGDRTAEACKEYGAVYAVFTGGAGALAAKAIREVVRVEWLDLGIPEALWVFCVEDFGPLLIVIDSHGNNLIKKNIIEAYKRRGEVLTRLYNFISRIHGG
jgi:fumarate hydratase subunit beta